MIAWWVCLILCFVFAWIGFFFCAVLVGGDLETPRPPQAPRTPETIGEDWLAGDWLEQWEKRGRS